jgi:hypothetical protein
LIDLGDARFRPFIEQLRAERANEEVRVAATIFSGFAKHDAITLWLDWAEELINVSGTGLFGSVASAIAIIGSRCRGDVVTEVQRDYPEGGPRILRRWTKQEYAHLIAPRLYELEAQEDAPKTFSQVLQCWDLPPRAAVKDQMIQ